VHLINYLHRVNKDLNSYIYASPEFKNKFFLDALSNLKEAIRLAEEEKWSEE
jgi:hypothetical protein